MVKLNRFIMNTDYDSFKVAQKEDWTINIPATTISGNNSQTYTYDFTVDPLIYFELVSATISEYPDFAFTGTSYFTCRVYYDSNTSEIDYAINVTKTSSTNYRVTVELSRGTYAGAPASTNVRATTLKVKVNLLVPTEQE